MPGHSIKDLPNSIPDSSYYVQKGYQDAIRDTELPETPRAEKARDILERVIAPMLENSSKYFDSASTGYERAKRLGTAIREANFHAVAGGAELIKEVAKVSKEAVGILGEDSLRADEKVKYYHDKRLGIAGQLATNIHFDLGKLTEFSATGVESIDAQLQADSKHWASNFNTDGYWSEHSLEEAKKGLIKAIRAEIKSPEDFVTIAYAYSKALGVLRSLEDPSAFEAMYKFIDGTITVAQAAMSEFSEDHQRQTNHSLRDLKNQARDSLEKINYLVSQATKGHQFD